MCRSAVNDGSCSPWVMCSCSVVRGNQIRDINYERQNKKNKSRKSHCRIFKEFICKLWWKISIWSPTPTFTSGFNTVQMLLLLLCALLPIFVLFSDLSKIFTSADQHSAQTTHFLEKEDSLPPTASSLHSGDR